MRTGKKVLLRAPAEHLLSYMLPITVAGIIPWLLVNGAVIDINIPRIAAGTIIAAAGLWLLIRCAALLAVRGRGTLAPWSATVKFVAQGPYKYTRNPMISAVIVILLGESLAMASKAVLAEAAVFFVINHFYFILSEEPGLLKRFGKPYAGYKRKVPRWGWKIMNDRHT